MQTYNIYDLIELEIITNNSKYVAYFSNEYEKMRRKTKMISLPKVKVVIGPLPRKQKGDIYGKRKFKKLFTFEYIIRDLQEKVTTIYFANHFIDKIYINAVGVYVQAQLLEPVMYYKLLKNNILFMHAAGVEKDSKGFLMPAYGGTGKTTLSLRLLSKGFRLLGDDLLLVDINKKVVHAYPRPFHLFTYNISSLEGAKVPIKYRVIIRTKNILRNILEKLTGEEFLISTRVHADELYSGDIWSTVVPYKRINFLKKEGEHETHELSTETSRRMHAEKIIASADLNESLLENIIIDHVQQKRFELLELEVVSSLLEDFKEIAYINTRQLSEATLEKYFDAKSN